jgi:hypothetical protein
MTRYSLLVVASALAFTSFARTQDAAQTAAQGQDPKSLPAKVLAGIWRIPIHTAKADPISGEYGWWASGDHYKVSFHDDFVFYPARGLDSPCMPHRWTTESIRVGETAILDADSERTPHHTEWRYEYRYPGVTEAYDVLPNGVEQTFVIHSRPAIKGEYGDLIVRGTVTSGLIAEPRQASHGELVFVDDKGTEILSYGKAFAFDATGRRIAITTAFDGKRITLTVPATWLAGATYPVTIDPLTSPTRIGAGNGSLFRHVDICRNDELNRLLVVFRNHRGVVAFSMTDSFGSGVVVFSDLRNDLRSLQCCYNGLSNKWCISMERRYSSPSRSRACVYIHSQGNTTTNSGTTFHVTPPSGYQDQTPTIGGTGPHVGNPFVYLAWRRDRGTGTPNTSTSQIYGATLRLIGTRGFSTPRRLSAGTRFDAEEPSISKQSLGGDWVVVWQSYDNRIIDDWDIRACRISNAGSVLGIETVGPTTTARHKINPLVSGAEGRWLFAFEESARNPTSSKSYGRGTHLAVQRGDWAGTGRLAKRAVRYLQSNTRVETMNRAIAYDFHTDSHWAVGYTLTPVSSSVSYVARVGSSGCVTETARLPIPTGSTYTFAPAIVFDADASRFALASWSGYPLRVDNLYAAHFSYPTAAKCTEYGVGCGGSAGCVNRGTTQPHAGSAFFAIRLKNAKPNQGHYLYVATGPASFPLGGGCFVNLNASFVPIAFGMTNPVGVYDFKARLPDCPVFQGDLYCQWFTVLGGRIKGSTGLKIAVR